MEQLSISDCKIERLSLQAANGVYDLIPHLLELNIYENLFSPHLSGNITLSDTYNLPYKLPIRGEETIECEILMEGAPDVLALKPPLFHIHNLSDRFLRAAGTSQQYTLNFVSEQCISNLHARVSKAYTNTLVNEIVEDIWETYLDDDRNGLDTEITYNEIDCIIPNWSPHYAMGWLAARAQPQQEGNAVNYVYCETLDGVFFKSLQSLAKQTPVLTFGLEPRVTDIHKVEALTGGYIKVDHMYFMDDFRKLYNIPAGNYSSKLITHDITTKKILQYDYSSLDDWEMYNHIALNKPIANSEIEVKSVDEPRKSFAPVADESFAIEEGPHLSQQTDSKVYFYPTHTNLYQNSAAAPDEVLYHNKVEEWKCQRNAQMSYYTTNAIKMQVQCSGLQFLRVGMMVKMNVPAMAPSSQDGSIDKFLSGSYMITAIRHIVANESANIGYKMIVDLVKDGLEETPPIRQAMKTEK